MKRAALLPHAIPSRTRRFTQYDMANRPVDRNSYCVSLPHVYAYSRERSDMAQIGYLVPEFPGQTHNFFWREIQALRNMGIVVNLVSTLRKTGELPCLRQGRAVRYDPADLRAWILGKKAPAPIACN